MCYVIKINPNIVLIIFHHAAQLRWFCSVCCLFCFHQLLNKQEAEKSKAYCLERSEKVK